MHLAQPTYPEVTGEMQDQLGLYFTVAIGYYAIKDEPASIEYYELEGDNISREELVARFGEDQVRRLEEEIH